MSRGRTCRCRSSTFKCSSNSSNSNSSNSSSSSSSNNNNNSSSSSSFPYFLLNWSRSKYSTTNLLSFLCQRMVALGHQWWKGFYLGRVG